MALRVNQLSPCKVSIASTSSERDLFWHSVRLRRVYCDGLKRLTMTNLPDKFVQVISGGAAMVVAKGRRSWREGFQEVCQTHRSRELSDKVLS